MLLVKEFAEQHDGRPGGRVVLFTSGQHLAPMRREVPYAVSKGALHQATMTLSEERNWITGQVIDSEGGFRRWALR